MLLASDTYQLIAPSTETLEYDPVSSRERVVAGLLACAFFLVVGLDVPSASMQAGIVSWVTPTVQAIAFCAFALTAWMLVAQYRVGGYAPLAILGCAFALSAAFRVALFLLDPMIVGGAVWADANLQSAWYLRTFSRIAFDLFVGLYAYADRRERDHPASTRARVVPLSLAAIALFAIGVLVATAGHDRLPTILDEHMRFTALYERVIAPVTLVCSALAGVLVLLTVNRRSRLRLWLFVLLVAMCADTIARAAGGALYTNGYYVSAAFEIIEATLFVFVVQAQIADVLRRAERTSKRAHALSETLALADAQSYTGIGILLARVVEELDFDYGALLHASEGELEVESAIGSLGYKKGQRIALEGTVTRHALSVEEMVVVEDFREPVWEELRVENGGLWESACVLPVFAEDVAYGSIAFANARERLNRLTPVDREYLRVVGVMIGNAIERIRQKRRLDELAYYDALTGLPNRVLLIDRITAALAMAERNNQKLAVHFLDLDDFKPVNDRFGHAVGDDVLRGVAKRLERTVRASDTIGRYGGDEFVVLQPVIEDVAGVADLQARIANALRDPIEVSAGSFKCSASIGTSVFPEDGRDAFTLVLRADEAQYRVKDARRAARANPPYESGN